MVKLSLPRPRRGVLIAAAAMLLMSAPAVSAAADPAVTVNGVGISPEVIEGEFSWILYQKSLFHPFAASQKPLFLAQAVDRVIVWEIIRQKLAAANDTVSAAEAEEYFAVTKGRWNDTYQALLEGMSLTDELYRRRTEAVQNFKKYRDKYISREVSVSESDIEEYYNSASRRYQFAGAYRTRVLQVYSYDREGRLTNGTLAEELQSIRKRLVGGEVLEEVNEDIQSDELYTRLQSARYQVGIDERFVPYLKDLAVGEWSVPIKMNERAYFLLRLDSKDEPVDLSLADAAEEIRTILKEQKLGEVLIEHVGRLKEEAEIVYHSDRYKPVPEDHMLQ